jgi:lipopolysaccharide biosynthesis protein
MVFQQKEVNYSTFPAGSMFAFKIAAMKPLLGLEIESHDFEVESKAADGTMAHAVERLFGLSVLSCGLKVIPSCWQNPFLSYSYAKRS